MNISRQLSFRLIASIGALCLGGQVCRAQSAPPALSFDRHQQFVNALQLEASGDIASAETSAVASSRSRPGTPQAGLEAAHRLFRLAYALRNQGHPAAANKIAARALLRIDAIRGQSSDAVQRAELLELAGQIVEEFVGDLGTAREYYRQAAAADGPMSAPTTASATTRYLMMNASCLHF